MTFSTEIEKYSKILIEPQRPQLTKVILSKKNKGNPYRSCPRGKIKARSGNCFLHRLTPWYSKNHTMPNYKLTYFNMRGRAEIIRYIFAYLDIKYEDHRIERSDWPEIKSTLPFGKVPILEVSGLNLHQSLAIARYLTKNTDLAGKTELQQCQVDAVVDTLDDFMSRFPWAEKKQDIKDQMFKELLTCDASHLLQDLDTYLGEKEWFIGNSEPMR
eukprot:XP_028347424.1 hematopoietic prostaglandin D synthase isoform X3 [Physeter catodon]